MIMHLVLPPKLQGHLQSIPSTIRSRFIHCVRELQTKVCDQRTSDSTLYQMACLFISGCICLQDGYSFEPNVTSRVSGHPCAQIQQAIRTILHWMSPGREQSWEMPVILNTLAIHDTSICQTVQLHGLTCVRKRIPYVQDGLPRYMAIVEIFVHRTVRQHPCIATLLGTYIHIDGTVDLFYEFIPYPISNFIGSRTTIPSLIRDLVSAVKCLHEHELAHRDLKLENIHVTISKRCVLLDMGAAGYGPRTTVPACTISYRSPEILSAEIQTGSIDSEYPYNPQKLDIWSMGVIILELYYGRGVFGKPSARTTPLEMLQLIQSHRPTALDRARGLPSSQHAILIRCLQDNPLKRPTIHDLSNVFL
jgi:hypothetical protein